MQYWFLGVSFVLGCVVLSTPKFLEVGAMVNNPRAEQSRPSADQNQGKGSRQPSHQQQNQNQRPSGYK